MKHMDVFAPGQEQNENFHLTNGTKGFKIAIWGNLTRNPRHKVLDFSELSIAATLPKPITLSNVAIRFLQETSGTVAPSFDLRQNPGQHWSVIGGVLNLDLVELPENPHAVENWTIRQILSVNGTLKRVDYPFKRPLADEGEEEQDGDTSMTPGQWALSVSFRVPSSIFVQRDKSKVMWWDDDAREWRDHGIEQGELELESGVVTFRTTQFRPTALVQDGHLEYPFDNWHISPTASLNRALLVVKGRYNEVEIEIGEGECRLLKPRIVRSGRPELAGLDNDTWFRPRILLHKMSRVGLNFAAPRTMKGVDLNVLKLKHPEGERILVSGISTCCPAYEFRRSADNRGLCVNRCALQFRQLDSHGEPLKVTIPPPQEMPDFQSTVSSVEPTTEAASRKSTAALTKSTASISKGKSKGDAKPKSRASSPDRESSANQAVPALERKSEAPQSGLENNANGENSVGSSERSDVPKALEVPWSHIVVDTAFKADDVRDITIAFASPKDKIEDNSKFAIQEGVVHPSVYHTLKGFTTDENHSRIDASSPLFTRTVSQLLHAMKVISFS
ncbi:hypothetical protein M427DRAFT_347405 [Gonapodya prolifera JEL478]|uniref:Uncharacterized protein n=1 Tax=Gonapodya prolifera (strain JEL478) TaxID=1344416 RepID=A0A139AVV6_GONPJ|nr:hypothetical protein M427DRAFT_347405 [Gonapodya prolifera JEL478]|eukprot:KXS20871.1 hypothetical protein M427DRAFT_347405 [Gonapodya prolifera JEL478]